MTTAVVHRVSIFPLAIPLRRRAAHGPTQGRAASPIVLAVELTKGTVGYGEMLPRQCITRENVDSVVEAIRTVFTPFLMDLHPTSFAEALDAIEGLPWHDEEGRSIPAARAAVELALLDAMTRAFHRSIDDVVQWMGLPGFGSPGSVGRLRFSGVLGARDIPSVLPGLRLMYWSGHRDFKLEVGYPGDQDRLQQAAGYLKRPIGKGRATLRVDARGQWSKDEAIEWLSDAAHLPIAAIEQPLARGRENELPVLHDLFDIPLVHDESLITIEDGEQLIGLGVAGAFNIQIGKCGGLMPSLRLAALARRNDVRVQLGCTLGETSILSAAALRFAQVCPAIEWAEGCMGSRLLGGDVVTKSLRFGYGGRPPRLKAGALGVDVDPQRLRSLCEGQPIVINL